MEEKKTYWGWSNEKTMWAWGHINPLGSLICKDKPQVSFENKDTDTELIKTFLKEKGFDLREVNVSELIQELYKGM